MNLNAPRNLKSSEEILSELNKLSPLALPQTLVDYEICDMQSSQEILSQIYQECSQRDKGPKEALLDPMLFSMVDSSIRAFGGHNPQKYGLSASKIIEECRNFSYESKDAAYNEVDEEAPSQQNFQDINPMGKPSEYDRSKMQDSSKMKQYKDQKFGDKRTARDEYQPDNKLRPDQKSIDNDKRVKNHNKNKGQHLAETDHIMPLENLHYQFEAFAYEISDEDRKRISNAENNLALTSRDINRRKGKKSNLEFVIKNRKTIKSKNEYIKTQTKAQGAVALEVGKIGTVSVAKEEIGELIVSVLGPSWHEISDIVKNGMCHNMNTDNPLHALGRRLKRMSLYILKKVPDLLKSLFSKFWDMIYDLILSIVSSIFKKFVFVVKEGIRIFIESVKILMVPSDKMSSAQKGDAIIKLIGGLLIAILIDLGMDLLLKNIGIPAPWTDFLSGVVAGICSAVFMYILDKIDLFSVKSEMRLARVQEIFRMRIDDIKLMTKNFDVAVSEALRSQRKNFEELRQLFDTAKESNDMNKLNSVLDNIAVFFMVEIPYSTTEEFLQYIKENETIVIGQHST